MKTCFFGYHWMERLKNNISRLKCAVYGVWLSIPCHGGPNIFSFLPDVVLFVRGFVAVKTCPYGNHSHMLHVWNIYQHLPHKSPSFVGKYTKYTIHGAFGIWKPSSASLGMEAHFRLVQIFFDNSWHMAAQRPDGSSMTHRSGPTGGHLLKFDFETTLGLEVKRKKRCLDSMGISGS